MSCKTPASIERSLSPMSPSNESRFVPRASGSVVDASSITEQHFAAAKQIKTTGEEKIDTGSNKSSESINSTSHQSHPPTLVADQEKDADIVGATICFTPQPSPLSSPTSERELANIDSFNSNSNNYIGSVNAVGSGDGRLGAVASKLSSSAMHVESSLDGQSTTEYEILDGPSGDSIVVEELMDVDEELAGLAKLEKELTDEDDTSNRGTHQTLADVSPVGTVASDTSLNMFKTPHPEKMAASGGKKSAQEDLNEDGPVEETGQDILAGLEEEQDEDAVALATVARNIPLKMTLAHQLEKKMPSAEQEKTNHVLETDSENVSEHSTLIKFLKPEAKGKDKEITDSSNNSPKVDASPLSPFRHLHKYWEGLGNILRKETLEGDGLKENEEAKDDARVDAQESNKFETPMNAKPSNSSGEHFTFEETGTAIESEGIIRANPKPSSFSLALERAKGFLASLANSGLSFILSAATFIGMLLCGYITSFLDTTITAFGHIILRTLRQGMSIQGTKVPIEVEENPQKQASTSLATLNNPLEPTGLNLSKLFLDEVVEEEDRKLGLAADPAGKKEGDEDKEHSDTALVKQEKATPKRIKDKVIDWASCNFKKALSMLKCPQVLYAIIGCSLTFMCSVGVYTMNMVWTDNQVIDDSGAQFYCLSTNATTHAFISLWELNLMPALFEAPEKERFVALGRDIEFEASVEELMNGEEPEEAGSSSWMPVFAVLSVLISMVCAFVFKSKLPSSLKPKSSPTPLTGLWTEDEHQQFLNGYNVHGHRWKLVSAFVPTRTPTQVKTHGCYWLKMRSPDRMQRTRKTPTPTKNTRKTLQTPSSVSSSKSTPRRSNKTQVTPLKGILIEQDNNHKNVTPRSEMRTRRMMQMKTRGSKSDPGKKRVRIQTPKQEKV